MSNQPAEDSTLKVTIYKIVCRENNRAYVGSTSRTMAERLSQHEFGLLNSAHHNPELQADFDKYGILAFDCAEVTRCSPEDRMDVEYFCISLFDSDHEKGCYNTVKGSKNKLAKRSQLAVKYRNIPPQVDWTAPGMASAMEYMMDLERIEAREMFREETKYRGTRRAVR